MSNFKVRYQAVRSQTLTICKPLAIEDYVAQPIDDVSPPKWHLAHTTWFFETFILTEKLKNYQVYNTDYAYMFNSYYVAAGERMYRPYRGNMTRPTVEEIKKYRAYVDEAMLSLLQQELDDSVQFLIELGLQHEQQHQELLYYDIKYILGQNPLFPIYDEHFNEYPSVTTSNKTLKIDKGNYFIGHNNQGFSYDNEHGYHEVHINGAEIAPNLVTNGEYAEFIADGGYKDASLWHSDAIPWIEENQAEAPLYWSKVEGKWHYYTLSGFKAIEEDAAVQHLSYYEASAFAQWKGMRLPTEFEWEVIADQLDWGLRWEQTSSAYLPYPYYRKPAGAIGEYNGKFMVNQMVLRGASVATAKNHSRNTYRNFFYPNMQWHFSGLRLAKDI